MYGGIEGCTLNWFKSYLNARTFSVCVCLDRFSSDVSVLDYGVPQGFILATALFSFYMLPPLGTIKHGVSFHFKAVTGDTQIYLTLKKNYKKRPKLIISMLV